MYTLNFVADYADTVEKNLMCLSTYTNVRLISIDSSTSDDKIRRISDNNDITQFICTLGYKYMVNIYSGMLIAKTYSFNELKKEKLISNALIYQSGPNIKCKDLAWLLYSVSDKYPVTLILDSNLPPYADTEGYGVIKLVPILVGENENAYYELCFPTSPDVNYSIEYRSYPNNLTYATRINGATCNWTYNTIGDDFIRNFDIHAVHVDDLNLNFHATL